MTNFIKSWKYTIMLIVVCLVLGTVFALQINRFYDCHEAGGVYAQSITWYGYSCVKPYAVP